MQKVVVVDPLDEEIRFEGGVMQRQSRRWEGPLGGGAGRAEKGMGLDD
jgi:hypothetical protein